MFDRHTDTATLRRILAERQLTQIKFGKLTELSYSTVNRVIRHERDLSDPAAFRVATALDLDLDAFTHRGPRRACDICGRERQAAA